MKGNEWRSYGVAIGLGLLIVVVFQLLFINPMWDFAEQRIESKTGQPMTDAQRSGAMILFNGPVCAIAIFTSLMYLGKKGLLKGAEAAV